MEERKFEDEWKDAFDQAEASPSDNLWTNIELSLEKAETGKMKRMLLFYKLMAAASVVSAMCIAGAGLYYYSDKNSPADIARNGAPHVEENTELINGPEEARAGSVNQTPEVSPNGSHETTTNENYQANGGLALSSSEYSEVDESENMVKKSDQSSLQAKNREKVNNKLPAFPVKNSMSTNRNRNDINAVSQVQTSRQMPLLHNSSERTLPHMTVPVKSKLTFPEQDPVAVMMAKLERREMELAGTDNTKHEKKEVSKNERLWTSVGFAAGTFNTVNQNAAQPALASSFASSNVTTNQSKASGASYSVGMNLGTRLSERWVLQGGVNYLTQNSSYEANSVVGSADFTSYQAASINSLSSKNTQAQGSKLVATVPYNVDNSVRFLSVPLQAGYVMVNHAVGLQINGGVSTDVFLQNKLSPQSNSLPTVTQGNGEDSPYRTINFSGLLGTEISYRFSKHYRLAVNPGIRYPFNSIYKSEVGIRAIPLTFDVGMRFRYIFH